MDQEQYKICLQNKLLFKARNPNYIINGLVTPGTRKIGGRSEGGRNVLV